MRRWPLFSRKGGPYRSNRLRHCPLLLCVLQPSPGELGSKSSRDTGWIAYEKEDQKGKVFYGADNVETANKKAIADGIEELDEAFDLVDESDPQSTIKAMEPAKKKVEGGFSSQYGSQMSLTVAFDPKTYHDLEGGFSSVYRGEMSLEVTFDTGSFKDLPDGDEEEAGIEAEG